MFRLIILFLFFLIFQKTNAQEEVDSLKSKFHRSFWAEGGIGTANSLLAIQGSASVEVVRHLILSYEWDGSFGLNNAIGYPTTTATDSRGLSLGYLTKQGTKLIYVTGGLARVKGVLVTDQMDEQFAAWGIKFRLGILFSGEYVAVGLSPYINLNSDLIFSGITANLAFGRFVKKTK